MDFNFTYNSTTLWTVGPVQSLSPCITMLFTFTITSIPLWTVRPVESHSAYTRVHFNFAYTSTPRMDRTACTQPQCLYIVALHFYLYPSSPMDRTACTQPQCLYNGALYIYVYLYNPYGPYSLYRASVTVQRCTLSLPIPLLPLCFVLTVQGLCACTKIHFSFTYTSTPPMDRTVCTEPQCMYKVAI